MADLTVTAAKVTPLNGAITRDKTAGGSGNVGDSVYYAADADAEQSDGSVAGTANGKGVVVAVSGGKTAFVAGDEVTIVVFGPVGGFSGMTPDTVGYVSDTAGKIADAAGTVSHVMGYAESAGVFFVNPAVA